MEGLFLEVEGGFDHSCLVARCRTPCFARASSFCSETESFLDLLVPYHCHVCLLRIHCSTCSLAVMMSHE